MEEITEKRAPRKYPEGECRGLSEEEFKRLFDEVGHAMDFQTIYLVQPLTTRTAGEVTAAVQSLVLRLKAEGLYISRMHADRARELRVESIKRWALERGIFCTYTEGQSPQANGKAEAGVKWVKSAVKRLLAAGDLPKEAWAVAANYATQTRMEQLLRQSSSMLPFGTKVHVRSKVYGAGGKYDLDSRWKAGTYVGPSLEVRGGHLIRFEDGAYMTSTHLRPYLFEPDKVVELEEYEVMLPMPTRRLREKSGPQAQEPEDDREALSLKYDPEHPAEQYAMRLLEEESMTADQLETLARMLPSTAPTPKRFGPQKDTQKVWTTGAYVHGGIVGVKKATAVFPASTNAFVKYVKQLDPDHKFNAVAVTTDIEAKQHVDAHNVGMNLVAGLSREVGESGSSGACRGGDHMLNLPHDMELAIGDLEDRACRLRDLLEEEEILSEEYRRLGQATRENLKDTRDQVCEFLEQVHEELLGLERLQTVACLRAVRTMTDPAVDDTVDYEALLDSLEEDLKVVHTVPVNQVRKALERWTAAIRKEVEALFSSGTLRRVTIEEAKEMESQGLVTFAPAKCIFTLKPTVSEPELWIILDEVTGVMYGLMVLYVDDIAYFSTEPIVLAVHAYVIEEWPASELEWITETNTVRYLGVEIGREVRTNEDGEAFRVYTIGQSAYVRDLLRSYDMVDVAPTALPVPKEWIETAENDDEPETDYDEQPDLMFVVSHAAGLVAKKPSYVVRLGTRLLAYLAGTAELKMTMGPTENTVEQELIAYTDASYAPFGRRSFGAAVITFAGSPVAWKSGRQSFITLSVTMEAELYAATQGCTLLNSVYALLAEVYPCQVRRVLAVDNTSAAAMLAGGHGSQRTRHLKIRANYVREAVEEGNLEIRHTPGSEQLADLSTKMQSKIRLQQLLRLWGFVGLAANVIQTMKIKLLAALMMLAQCVCPARGQGVESKDPLPVSTWDELLIMLVLIAFVVVCAWELLRCGYRRVLRWHKRYRKAVKYERMSQFTSKAAKKEDAAVSHGILCRKYAVTDYLNHQAEIFYTPGATEAIDTTYRNKRLMVRLISTDVTDRQLRYVLYLWRHRSKAFSSLSALRVLDASRNRLVLTNSTPFDALTDLELLDLSDNKLTDLPPGLFRNLQKLTALSLAENELKVLPPGTFQGLEGLRRLDLHVAGLHELQQEAFRGLDSLGFLDLSQNSLCDLPDGSFGSLSCAELGDTPPFVTMPGRGSVQTRHLQTAIHDAASRGPRAFLGFLQPHTAERFASWSPYNLTAALHKIVGMRRSRLESWLVEELRTAAWELGAAAVRSDLLDSRQLSNLLLDLRQLELWDVLRKLGPELLKRVDTGFSELSAWDLTNALSGCAAPALLDDLTLKAVFRAVMHKLAGCDAWYWCKWKGKDVANTAYALGLWRQSADDLVSTADAWSLTQSLWTRTLELAAGMEAEEYVNVLWAMSEFRVKGSHLCQVVDTSLDVLRRCRRNLGPDLLSRFASALAELCRRQGTENPQDRSRASTTGGSNYVNSSERIFFEMVAEESWRMTWPVARRGRLVWSFACMRLKHVALFEHVLGESRWEMCSEGGLADICWALVTVQPAEVETSSRLRDLLPHLSSRRLPQWLWLLLLWCFAVADISIPSALQEHIYCALSSTGAGHAAATEGYSWTEIDARMLDQVLMLLGWQSYSSSFCPTAKGNPPMPSAFQRDVFDMLEEMGLTPEFEAEGFDLFVRDRCLAMEVNGPAHYALDLEHWDYHAEVGRSLLKRRLASKKGYHFVTVPWWEWDQALRDRGGRRGYLQSLVSRHMTTDWGSAFASTSDLRGQRSDSAEAETKRGYTPAGAPWSDGAQMPVPPCRAEGSKDRAWDNWKSSEWWLWGWRDGWCSHGGWSDGSWKRQD
ncbi:Lgr4 [Symbiodinium sp. CCMP2592]|nr:Lgr4 [Symbiodinium sp. CCMP2592]